MVGDVSQRRGERLGKIGLVVSLIYLLAISIFGLALANSGWLSITPMRLNEAGDLLAGLFGPLAIFWLALGFFQQGEELRQSVEALRLQAEELKSSVAQQRELVLITTKQLELDTEAREAESRESFESRSAHILVEYEIKNTISGKLPTGNLLLHNVGETAEDVTIMIELANNQSPYKFSIGSLGAKKTKSVNPRSYARDFPEREISSARIVVETKNIRRETKRQEFSASGLRISNNSR